MNFLDFEPANPRYIYSSGYGEAKVKSIYGGPVRLICHAPAEATWNMATDEVLAQSVSDGGKPVIRIYGFSSTTVSIGRFQSITDLNERRLKEDGINLVRRPTGGKAVLHSTEVTYSVALGREHLRPFSKRRVYHFVGDLLIGALTVLGVHCGRNISQIGSPSDANCFGAVGEYEIVGQFGKIIGSAQMIMRHGVLQQGSIPLTCDYQNVRLYLKCNLESDAKRASWIEQEVGHPTTFDHVAIVLQENIKNTLGPIEESDLSTNELERAEDLALRFASKAWTQAGKT